MASCFVSSSLVVVVDGLAPHSVGFHELARLNPLHIHTNLHLHSFQIAPLRLFKIHEHREFDRIMVNYF